MKTSIAIWILFCLSLLPAVVWGQGLPQLAGTFIVQDDPPEPKPEPEPLPYLEVNGEESPSEVTADEHTLIVFALRNCDCKSAMPKVRDLNVKQQPLLPAYKLEGSPWCWGFTAPPGDYRVEVLATDAEGSIVAPECLVTIKPRGPPKPNPDEDDPPKPPEDEIAGGPRFLLLMYESDDQTPEQAKTWDEVRDWADKTTDPRHRFVKVDKDVTASWLKQYRNLTQGQYPYLVMQEDKSGGVLLYKGAPPDSFEGFQDLVANDNTPEAN